MQNQALHIDLNSATPAYRQIVDGLRAMLVAGVLEPGSRLPPVRQLAADLTVHHNTVAEAYRILAAEGWLDLRQGRGAVVVERVPPPATPADEDWLACRIRELVVQAVAKGIGQDRAAKLFHDAVADMTVKTKNKDSGHE
jgi:GntR family transcriptional regulator